LIAFLLNIDESGSTIVEFIGSIVFTLTLELDIPPKIALATKYAISTLTDAISRIIARSDFFMA
jgi:hypothetical protein